MVVLFGSAAKLSRSVTLVSTIKVRPLESIPPRNRGKSHTIEKQFGPAAAHSAKDRKLGKGTRWPFFQEIMERAQQLTYKKKMDLLGNMFASCCPITFTQPHRPI